MFASSALGSHPGKTSAQNSKFIVRGAAGGNVSQFDMPLWQRDQFEAALAEAVTQGILVKTRQPDGTASCRLTAKALQESLDELDPTVTPEMLAEQERWEQDPNREPPLWSEIS
jgi:hypothetical protein